MSRNKSGAIKKMAQSAGMDVYSYVEQAVSEHGSATAAAAALGVSQPSISYYIVSRPRKITIDQVKRALDEHGSVKAAAAALQTNPPAVYSCIHRAGMKIRSRVELVPER